jgi:hypothetical protein
MWLSKHFAKTSTGFDLTMLDKLLTANDVAAYLAKPVKAVHQLVREGKLSCIQLSAKDRRFTEEHVKDYLDNQTKAVPNRIDTKAPKPLPYRPKRGAKSVEDFGTDLVKEMRSLCQ